jgi:chromosome segregation ATPase
VSTTPNYVPQPEGAGWKTAVVAAALVILAGANIYLYVQIDHARADLAKVRDTMSAEIANLRDTSSVTAASQRRLTENLKEELAVAQQQAARGAGQAKAEATAKAEMLAKRLEVAQNQMQEKFTGEIGEVRQAATTAQEKIAAVNTEVGNVKTEVATNKSEIDKTVAALKSVTGDLGVQSGLIATNAKELDALKQLGQRNYFEFKLGKTKAPQRVGDVMVHLKKTDPKRNKYTIDLLADDKTTEKKDKGINEPVQFYTSKARQPYELVVNQVQKDLIVGYLSTPKVQVAR